MSDQIYNAAPVCLKCQVSHRGECTKRDKELNLGAGSLIVHRNLLNAAKEMLHRATEGEPDGYADGLIGVTDHQAAAIWLKAEINKAENEKEQL